MLIKEKTSLLLRESASQIIKKLNSLSHQAVSVWLLSNGKPNKTFVAKFRSSYIADYVHIMSSSPFFEEFLLYNYSKHNQVDFGTMTNIGFKCF